MSWLPTFPEHRDCAPQDRRFRLVALPWSAWLRLLDGAGAPSSQGEERLQTDVMLSRWLQSALRQHHETHGWVRLTGEAIAELSAAEADYLAAEGAQLWQEQRNALALQVDSTDPKKHLIKGNSFTIEVRAWTFSQRNEVLRKYLHTENGELVVHMAGFEIAEIQSCCRIIDNDNAKAPVELLLNDIQSWPVPLGETVAASVQAVNDVEDNFEETVSFAAQHQLQHPDLDMAILCRGFGWTPDQVAALPAQQAQRLLSALRVLEASAPPAFCGRARVFVTWTSAAASTTASARACRFNQNIGDR